MTQIKHLIIVPGHAIYHPKNWLVPSDPMDNGNWVGLFDPEGISYQYQTKLYYQHIETGINLVQSDPQSFLVFSGGYTREGTQISEAFSYLLLGRHTSIVDNKLMDRISLDEFARDSYENVYFSILQFKHELGYYPSQISVVGFAFKQQRFIQHLHEIGSHLELSSQHNYIDVNNPDEPILSMALKGEEKTRLQFEASPSDLHPALSSKREGRDPLKRGTWIPTSRYFRLSL